MQILHVINIYFSLAYFGDQFKYFSEKGYNQHLICSSSPHLKEYSNKQNIQFNEIPITRKITPIQDLISLIKICLYIRKNKIDIVVGHTPKGALLSMIAAVIMRVPKRIYYRHGFISTAKGIMGKIILIEERFVSFCATKIVCVSPSLFQLSIDLKLNPTSKQTILGKGTCGGIDTNKKFNPDNINENSKGNLKKQLQIPQDAFVVGYCGRLVNDKGIAELVKGFKLLQDKYPRKKLRLLLVGMFDERDSLATEVVTEIKSDSDIIYTGFIKENIELYYSIMDMLILPSYREGFGMSVLEASSMKLPILTTRSVGCIDSIIEGKTGFYVEINPESIAGGIEKYFDSSMCLRLGENGRKMVKQDFDNLVLWKEIEKLYL